MSFNKIIIVGNLGKDPDLRYTPQGIAVATMTIATNEKRKDKSGELQDVTTWFKVTLWRQMAENAAKYLSKGSPIYVEGRLQIEEWTDRDNNNRFTLAVNASDMQFIASKQRDDEGGGSYQHSQARDDFPSHSGGGPPISEPTTAPTPRTSAVSNAADDDIPF